MHSPVFTNWNLRAKTEFPNRCEQNIIKGENEEYYKAVCSLPNLSCDSSKYLIIKTSHPDDVIEGAETLKKQNNYRLIKFIVPPRAEQLESNDKILNAIWRVEKPLQGRGSKDKPEFNYYLPDVLRVWILKSKLEKFVKNIASLTNNVIIHDIAHNCHALEDIKELQIQITQNYSLFEAKSKIQELAEYPENRILAIFFSTIILHEAPLTAEAVIEEFKKKHKLEKL
jgi:hypothetical protein